jgi:hypothetical protein
MALAPTLAGDAAASAIEFWPLKTVSILGGSMKSLMILVANCAAIAGCKRGLPAGDGHASGTVGGGSGTRWDETGMPISSGASRI